MNLEDQICSLELAKRLKELGVNQKSLFCYQEIIGNDHSVWPRTLDLHRFKKPIEDDRVAAHTVAELGAILPLSIIYEEYELILGMIKGNEEWITIYYEEESYTPLDCRDSIMANSMAKMLIYLIENGLIKVSE